MGKFITILVCGSRTFKDEAFMRNKLSNVIADLGDEATDVKLITGGAAGADTIAEKIGRGWKWEVSVFKADWTAEPKRAGYIRNQRMLDEGKPNLVLAFFGPAEDDSRGTSMMVDIARKAGVPGWSYRPHITPDPIP